MKLAAVRKYALSLPGVTEEPHHHFGSFRVRGKIFVTVLPEADHLHLFVSEQQRERALVLYSEFTEKLWWGGKVVGVRLALGVAPPAVVRNLVRQAWANKAPKSLLGSHPMSGG